MLCLLLFPIEGELVSLLSTLRLTAEEKQGLDPDNGPTTMGFENTKHWMVGKLHTNRSSNKDAMISTLKVIWRTAKEVSIVVLEENLFLFKFASEYDKNKVLDGSPWLFDQKLLLFHDYNGDLRPSEYTFTTAPF
ncbi:hypothetical protein REPUB_Repub11eG0085500 [Reevesia pubescens]